MNGVGQQNMLDTMWLKVGKIEDKLRAANPYGLRWTQITLEPEDHPAVELGYGKLDSHNWGLGIKDFEKVVGLSDLPVLKRLYVYSLLHDAVPLLLSKMREETSSLRDRMLTVDADLDTLLETL